jgi:hypothetical protein
LRLERECAVEGGDDGAGDEGGAPDVGDLGGVDDWFVNWEGEGEGEWWVLLCSYGASAS